MRLKVPEVASRLQVVPDGRTRPWGTTGAVALVAPEVDGAFAVANADDLDGVEAFRSVAAHLRSGSGRGAVVGYPTSGTPVRGDDLVSMNCWGFPAGVMPVLRDRVAAFVARAPGGGDAERVFPDVVADLLEDGSLDVDVLPTSAAGST